MAEQTEQTQREPFILKNVRISYPHLWTRPTIRGVEGSFGAVFLLDPVQHEEVIRQLGKNIKTIYTTELRLKSLASERICLRKGEDKGKEEYGDSFVLSANSKSKPVVIDGNLQPVEKEEDSRIYAGCRVNAKVRLWPQNNAYGKRVNCALIAVQFAGDDEPLDGSYISTEDAIEGFEGNAGDDLGFLDDDNVETETEDDLSFLD